VRVLLLLLLLLFLIIWATLTVVCGLSQGNPIGGASFAPLLAKYQPRRSVAGCCVHNLTLLLAVAVYAAGFASLYMYASFLAKNSPSMTFKETALPVLLHVVGVGSCAALKTYYDFSKAVGYFEAMALIIRSRMWLFPGALGPTQRVKREDVEAERRHTVQAAG
jgi:hypothetical protein